MNKQNSSSTDNFNDYNSTPSFYNTNETFQKYLACTSYYTVLQNSVCKIAKFLDPKSILELGSGTGSTSIRLANENTECYVTGVDMRTEAICIGNQFLQNQCINNLDFVESEMVSYVEKQQKLPELLVLLYSFHHIPDPLKNKIDFLKLCKTKLPENGKICIGETFLLNNIDNPNKLELKIKECWINRCLEAYSSTFWASLNGTSPEDVNKAKEIGRFSREHENIAGNLVLQRKNEYLVSLNWLLDEAVSLGFSIEIAEPCNAFGDAIVLLSK